MGKEKRLILFLYNEDEMYQKFMNSHIFPPHFRTNVFWKKAFVHPSPGQFDGGTLKVKLVKNACDRKISKSNQMTGGKDLDG